MANIVYTKELLEPIVKSSISWAEVLRKLGKKPASGGTQSHIVKRCSDFGISASHFLGQGHNKGKTFKKKPLSFYLKTNSKVNSSHLLKRLISAKIKERVCEMCNRTTWMGDLIPLELDHINGNHFDNRLKNLQALCPNCHYLKHKKQRKNGS